jgi:hypothetical protein
MTHKSRKSPQPPKQPTRGLSRFKRSEAKRLLQSAVEVGLNVSGLEVDPNTGALRVLVGAPAAANAPDVRRRKQQAGPQHE